MVALHQRRRRRRRDERGKFLMARAGAIAAVALPTIRPGNLVDLPEIDDLIRRSAKELSVGFYRPDQIAAAIAHVFGADSVLIEDGTYFVADLEGELLGCGGWSRRRTLFGGNDTVGRDPGLLEPGRDPARIRAFFVAPHYARRGLATGLLAASEAAARAAGFDALTLMATLPGVPFYTAAGFTAAEPIEHRAGDTPVPLVPMHKKLTMPARTGMRSVGRGTREGN